MQNIKIHITKMAIISQIIIVYVVNGTPIQSNFIDNALVRDHIYYLLIFSVELCAFLALVKQWP